MKVFREQFVSSMILWRSIVIILLVANLTGCGFYLAGSSSLPPQLASIQLLADNLDSSQKTALKRQLIQAGANLEDNQGGDVVRLMVVIEVLRDRNLVDTAGSGKTIVRLFHQLSYSLTTAAGELLVDQKTILRQRDIELDSDDLAGLEYEKQNAGALLDQALFGQLLFQLQHLQI